MKQDCSSTLRLTLRLCLERHHLTCAMGRGLLAAGAAAVTSTSRGIKKKFLLHPPTVAATVAAVAAAARGRVSEWRGWLAVLL